MNNLMRNAMLFQMIDRKNSELGRSKVGGLPDLPADFEWPTNSSNGDIPLTFIAQFDLVFISKYDLNNELPSHGMLYFFYDFSSEVTGGSPSDSESVNVFYYDASSTELISTDIPENLDEEYIIPEIFIRIESENEIPCIEEIEEILFGVENKELILEDCKKYGRRNHISDCKLLGYSDLIQGSMLTELIMVQNGIDVNGFDHLYKKKKYHLQAKDWVLLFQLDLIETEDFFLEIGDSGRLYIFIKKDDLKKGDFSKVWAMTQSY